MSSSIFRETWQGFDKIKYLIILGDSYSDIGYRGRPKDRPTLENPLGIPFPGLTWNESDQPNWVGHLLKQRDADKPLLVYDYAIGGHTIDGIRQQVRLSYIKDVGAKPDWAPWTSQDSLFVIWIGINDCSWVHDYLGTDVEHVKIYQQRLFQYVKEVYDTGARNFLFIEVPPMERAPGMSQTNKEVRAKGYSNWNIALHSGVSEFASKHADITTMIFPAHELFHKVLDSPASFGLDASTVNEEDGSVWFDAIHITSQMHRVVANGLLEFLNRQSPTNGPAGA